MRYQPALVLNSRPIQLPFRPFLLLLCLFLLFIAAPDCHAARPQDDPDSPSGITLKVVTGEFRAVKGNLIIELSDSTGGAFAGGTHPVTGTTVTVRFDSLAPGPRAVRLFHDENSNDTLDTNFFGIPSEGYGFSNNPRSRFGEPSFKDRLFELRTDTTIHVTLTYW
ncbi:MAG: DUF2141 domain-containing protein [Balneolaceae bacterium]|nr:MAG: DUF2141 domain-containing protein [Balneolaceae bacterium]